MDNCKKQELERKITNASPFEFVRILQEIEQYDKEETKVVVDELYKYFETEENVEEQLLKPIFVSVIDGFLEATSATRKLRKKGITASRLVSECSSFIYDQEFQSDYILDGYTEYKNVGENASEDFVKYGDEVRPKYDGNRQSWEDKKHLQEYKDEAFANNGNRINAMDEYTGKKNIYKEQANPDARRNIKKYKHRNQAHVDHIEPLSKIHERLKGNYALSDEDIKNIANADYNFALTAAYINNGTGVPSKGNKGDKTIPDFIAEQNEKERKGEPNLGLTPETKERMLREWKRANKEIDKQANKTIAGNIFNPQNPQQKVILEKNAKQAWKQSKDYMVGNVILFIIKPLYFEMSDIFHNGLKEGVNASSVSDALRIRFGRIRDFVLSNALIFLGTSAWDFVRGFISSFIEGLISLFVGVFKQFLKLIKEGIQLFVQAGKVLFGEQAKQMSFKEKGDAIIKILGGSVIAICGIGIEALLNKIGIGEPWSVVVSTMLSGIASTLFMYSLDKLDLFNVKAETRQARIDDIFNERIKVIKETTKNLNEKVIKKMKLQKLELDRTLRSLDDAISSKNYEQLNETTTKLMMFLGIRPLLTEKMKWEM